MGPARVAYPVRREGAEERRTMEKASQATATEYEILDLEGDLDGARPGPAHPRPIDDRIVMLSGGLFDGLPRVEVPLDSFFPSQQDEDGRSRSDSLAPAAMDSA